MKKIVSYILVFLLLLVAITACGKPSENQNLQNAADNKLAPKVNTTATDLTNTERRPDSPTQTIPSGIDNSNITSKSSANDTRVTSNANVQAHTPSGTTSSVEESSGTETSSKSSSESRGDSVNISSKSPEVTVTENTPESPAKPPAPSYGITMGENGSVIVGRDTAMEILKEEHHLVAVIGYTDEEINELLEQGDLIITTDMQKALQDYLGTLPLTDQLRLLARLAELMDT